MRAELTPEEARAYKSWNMMLQRVNNPNNDRYKDYGGRGITVTRKWLTFDGFLADMGGRPEGMSLERRRTNGNYCKSNCKWATPKQQSNNVRRNKWIRANGERLTVSQWSAKRSIPTSTIFMRLKRGWTPKQAIGLA